MNYPAAALNYLAGNNKIKLLFDPHSQTERNTGLLTVDQFNYLIL